MMLTVTVQAPSAAPVSFEIPELPCRIGKHASNEVVLPSWRVARVHAELRASRVGIKIFDTGSLAGTWVNGERIAEYGPIDDADDIQIAGFSIRVHEEINGQSSDGLPITDALGSTGNAAEKSIARSAGLDSAGSSKLQLENHWQRLVQRRLVESIDLRRQDLNSLTNEQLRLEISGLVANIVMQMVEIPVSIDLESLKKRVIDEAIGLGPLESLLEDATITEVMVNGHAEVFVERNGQIEKSNLQFSSPAALSAIVDRIVGPIGRRIDESSPMVDARLADGSRVNVVIPPLAINGAVVTIRKFSKRVMSPDSLVSVGSASAVMMEFFKLCIERRKNLVVSGGTGSGKTTLLNVLSNLIPDGQRVITIEDAAELRLAHSHWVSLESRPMNAEGRGEVAIRDLLRNSLRMRPDRIVIGECRGPEAIDMLQAMNTGHDGSMTTVHANSPRDGLRRLESMVLMAGIDMPLQAIREQMVSAIDLVVQQQRLPSGQRTISEVLEVVGIEGQRIQTQSLFKFNAQLNRHDVCGVIPQFFEDIDFDTQAEKALWLERFSQV